MTTGGDFFPITDRTDSEGAQVHFLNLGLGVASSHSSTHHPKSTSFTLVFMS